MRPRALACLVFSLFVVSGCGYFRKVGDCRRIAARVNRTLDEIAAAHDAGGPTAATYRDLAGRYERLSQDVEAAAKSDDALGKTLREYSQGFIETSRSLKALADATDQNDATASTRLKRELGTLARRDKTLVNRLDAICAEP